MPSPGGLLTHPPAGPLPATDQVEGSLSEDGAACGLSPGSDGLPHHSCSPPFQTTCRLALGLSTARNWDLSGGLGGH